MRTIPLLACLLLLAAGCRDDGTGPSEARVASIRLSRTAAPLDDGATLRLTAEPLDGAGRVLPAGRVRLSWSSSDDAVATVADGLVTGRRPGEARITATAGKASASAQVTVLPVPQALGAAAGAAQEGVAGMPAPQEIAALLTDRHGGGVAGVAVEFVVVKGGGTVAPASAQTDAQGRARAAWTLGTAAGENAVEARVAGRPIAPARFVAMARAGPPARLEKLAGDAQQGTAASQLPLPLVVRVVDAFGNPLAGASVSWRCTSGGSHAPGASVTDVAGEARVTWLLGPGAGEQGMEAWVEGFPAARVQFSAGVGVGAAARLEKVSGDLQEAVVTSPLPEPLVVRVVDAPGNPLPGVRVAWKLFYGGGTVAPAESVTDAQGRVRAAWTFGRAAGVNAVEARVAGRSLAPAVFAATAEAGPPARREKLAGD
ncbi:MAG TPA: Ig-like domain-containing protein, partial [Longimicrobiaceae bacterium]|nr:Ig-like domain-containing protein [Longimicrobiaceae bacterium]